MIRKKSLAAALTVVAVVVGTIAVVMSPARALTNCTVSAEDQAVDSEEAQLLVLINQYRVANGLNALTMDPAPTRAAAWFARDMATFNYVGADHVDRLGRDIPTRLTQCDVLFTAWGENIAWGYDMAEEVFQAWRNSPTHNAIMLNQNVTLAGIARAFNEASTFDWYWVLDVTAPAGGTTTSSSTSTTTASTTTTTSATTTTVVPTTTSTSTTVVPTTSTTVAPTTTTTGVPATTTTTTGGPATTTTTVVGATTTTVSPTTTTTGPPPVSTCDALRARRAAVNAQITALESALAQRFSGAQLTAQIAQLERIRAAANAQFDAILAREGC